MARASIRRILHIGLLVGVMSHCLPREPGTSIQLYLAARRLASLPPKSCSRPADLRKRSLASSVPK